MKNLIISGSLLVLFFGACKTSQVASYSDDLYANPAEDKRLARLAAVEAAKKEALEKQKQEEAVAAKKAKDDANPYYKDPQYNQDDYYDYQYASRVKRFGSPIYGAGYYDNYYTNSYWYNQNPSSYGTSIYSTYNWMPSNQFNNYNYGLGYNNGYNNYNNYNYGNGNCWNSGYYNPYNNNYNYVYYNGYNNGYNNGYYGYGYNPYGYNSYGYGNNNYNNNGWGYFNSYDVNSAYSKMTYGVRGSNGGGNSTRNTSAGMAIPQEYAGENNARQVFIDNMAQKQEQSPRFTEMAARPKNTVKENNGVYNTGQNASNNSSDNGSVRNPVDNGNINNGGSNTGTQPTKSNTGFWPSIFGGNSTSGNTDPAVKNNESNNSPSRARGDRSNRVAGTQDMNEIKAPSNSSNKSVGSDWNPPSNPGGGNSGGSTAPRGGGGGGNSRPR